MKLADSSCMVCIFVEINKPFILLDWMKRGYQIVITEQVYKELQINDKTNKAVAPEIKNGTIKIKNLITEQDIKEFRNRFPNLGLGECSVMLTALKLKKENKRYYAIFDDGAARKVATKLGITITGTYGLLKTLKDKGQISEEIFNQCKQEMSKSKFRINFEKIK